MPEPGDPDYVAPRLSGVVYDLVSGEILQRMSGVPADLLDAQAGPGQGVLATSEPASGRDWYVDLGGGGVLRRRPPIIFDRQEIVADGVDQAVAVIPGPFVVAVDGAAYDGVDSLEFSADVPGVYLLEIEAFPSADLRVEIVAVAP